MSRTIDRQRWRLAGIGRTQALEKLKPECPAPWALTAVPETDLMLLLWPSLSEQEGLPLSDIGRINLDVIALMGLAPFVPTRLTSAEPLDHFTAALQGLSPETVAAHADRLMGMAEMALVFSPDSPPPVAQSNARDYLRQVADHKKKATQPLDEDTLSTFVSPLISLSKQNAASPKTEPGWRFLVPLDDLQRFQAQAQSLLAGGPAPNWHGRCSGPFVPLGFAPTLYAPKDDDPEP